MSELEHKMHLLVKALEHNAKYSNRRIGFARNDLTKMTVNLRKITLSLKTVYYFLYILFFLLSATLVLALVK